MRNPSPSTGSGLYFGGNGTESGDDADYLYIAPNSSTNFSGTQAFTLMAWVRADDLATNEFRGIIDRHQTGAPDTDVSFPNGRRMYTLYVNSSVDRFEYRMASICGGGGTVGVTRNTSNITAGQWYHVAVTRTGSTVAMYVNGASDSSQIQAHPSSIPDCQGPMLIGITNSQSTEVSSLKGGLDDIRIYNRVLSVEEINSIYSSKTSANTFSNMVAQYKLDSPVIKDVELPATNVDGNRFVMEDSSGNGNNAILKNGYTESSAANYSTSGPTPTSGSPVVDGRILWVGTNDGSSTGGLTAISLDTDRRIRSYNTSNSGLPNNRISSLSMNRGGLALVGTSTGGAWAPGTAGFVVDDTASSQATAITPVRFKNGTTRLKGGVRLK